MVMITLGLGLCDIYDAACPEKVPPINTLGCTGRGTINQYPFPGYKFYHDDDKNWEALQPALRIVERVCPEAKRWCEERRAKGKIVWCHEMSINVASFDAFSRVLTFNPHLAMSPNGEIACTIIHEFRHSRQNFTKSLKRAVLLGLLQQDFDGIVENDAYLYQHEAHIAIFE